MHLLCRSCISHPVVFCKIDSFIEWTLQKACTEQNKPFRWPPESAEKYRKHGLKSCYLPFSRMGARPGTGSALPAASRVEFGHSSMQGTPLLFTHDLTGNERKSSNTAAWPCLRSCHSIFICRASNSPRTGGKPLAVKQTAEQVLFCLHCPLKSV